MHGKLPDAVMNRITTIVPMVNDFIDGKQKK
jgi:hypothetical protein